MAKRNEAYRYCSLRAIIPTTPPGFMVRSTSGRFLERNFPTHLHVECSKDLVNPTIYSVGTRFRLRVKLTDRQGDGEFLYSYFGWPVEVVE